MNKNLVADLGGTNIRFALSNQNSTNIEQIRNYPIRDYESIHHLINVYVKDIGLPSKSIRDCCFAIAGPIENQTVKMTNCDWSISANAINDALSITTSVLINDFEAIAYAVPNLDEASLTSIGTKNIDFTKGPVSVFGPGTGLGAALLVPYTASNTQKIKVIPTEGGHAGLSARTEAELAIFDYWRNKGCRINREFFVCGSGIERIHEALCNIDDQEHESLSAANIQQKACANENTLCNQAMALFCSLLGSAAGDQVLCTGSTGGLVLAGGILPKFVEFLNSSDFRKRFESKGVMSSYNEKIATALIIEKQPGLIGAASYLVTQH